MSVEAIDAVIASRITPPSLKLTLLVLANHMNKHTGRCDPGVDTVAEEVGVSRGQALRLIGDLKAAELIAVRHRGGHQTSQYTLNFDRIAAYRGRMDASPRGGAGATPRKAEKDTPGSADAAAQSHAGHPRGSTDAASGVASVLPKPEAKPEVQPESNLPSLRDGAAAAPQQQPMTLSEFLNQEKQAVREIFPEGDALYTYRDKVGLPMDFLHLAWKVFKSDYTGPTKASTVCPDWRQSFRTHVEKCWLRLWYIRDDTFALTPAGMQAELAHAPETEA
jgi:hypothetical protein